MKYFLLPKLLYSLLCLSVSPSVTLWGKWHLFRCHWSYTTGFLDGFALSVCFLCFATYVCYHSCFFLFIILIVTVPHICKNFVIILFNYRRAFFYNYFILMSLKNVKNYTIYLIPRISHYRKYSKVWKSCKELILYLPQQANIILFFKSKEQCPHKAIYKTML